MFSKHSSGVKRARPVTIISSSASSGGGGDDDESSTESCGREPKRARRTINDALMPRKFTAADIAELRSRYTPDTNKINAHPMDERIRTDFEEGRHDYYVDGKKCDREEGWISVTGFVHIFWEDFQREF